jgi:hypothetical protein
VIIEGKEFIFLPSASLLGSRCFAFNPAGCSSARVYHILKFLPKQKPRGRYWAMKFRKPLL